MNLSVQEQVTLNVFKSFGVYILVILFFCWLTPKEIDDFRMFRYITYAAGASIMYYTNNNITRDIKRRKKDFRLVYLLWTWTFVVFMLIILIQGV